MDRRDFLRTASVGAFATTGPVRLKPDTTDEGASDRDYWVSVMRRLADPVLTNLANGTLKARMPVEQGASDRRSVTHLEAIGRLMAGLAPWIELGTDETSEGRLRAQYTTLAHRAIARAVDPSSRQRLAAHRLLRPSAWNRGDLHLDRQRVSVLGRIASARTRVERRILVRAAPTLDVGESVVGAAVSDRPRALIPTCARELFSAGGN